jgi:LAO/AO transport system kinase
MELADLVVVTKADGDLLPAARRAEADHRHAVHFLRRRFEEWEPRVLAVSSIDGTGVPEVWSALRAHHDTLVGSGTLDALRAAQSVSAFWREVERVLLARLRAGGSGAELDALVAEVESGRLPAPVAAWRALHP